MCIGQTNDELSISGEYELNVRDVTQSFGKCLKYYIKAQSSVELPPARNAFEIMISAQRSLATVKYPPVVTMRNKRDKQFSDLLSLCKFKQLCGNLRRCIVVWLRELFKP